LPLLALTPHGLGANSQLFSFLPLERDATGCVALDACTERS